MKEHDWTDAYPEVPEGFHQRVEDTLLSLEDNRRSEDMRKRFSWKKAVLVTAAATFVMGTTVFAAGYLKSTSIICRDEEKFDTMPSQSEVEEKTGVDSVIISDFSNGYTYVSSNVVGSEEQDDNGETVGTFKEMQVDYEKGDDNFSLFMDSNETSEEQPVEPKLEETYQECDLNYYTYQMKTVPVDYEMTEQDLEDQKSGKYFFNCSEIDEIEITTVQNLMFSKDGVNYNFLLLDSTLTEEDLVTMAEEVIDAQ